MAVLGSAFLSARSRSAPRKTVKSRVLDVSDYSAAGMVDTVAFVQSNSIYPGSLQLVAHFITTHYDGSKPSDNG